MEIRKSTVASRMILLCFLAVLSQSGARAMKEQPPPPAEEAFENQHLNPIFSAMDLEDPAEKRAYTYVSEYKRLPLYNFGIGKRWIDTDEDKRAHQYSFGLGKRTRPYSFGLGKRSDRQEFNPLRTNYDYPNTDGLHSREETFDDFLEEKRGRQPYSFGLGKRALNPASSDTIGAGKRPNDMFSQRYHFGLGKRSINEEDPMQ